MSNLRLNRYDMLNDDQKKKAREYFEFLLAISLSVASIYVIYTLLTKCL